MHIRRRAYVCIYVDTKGFDESQTKVFEFNKEADYLLWTGSTCWCSVVLLLKSISPNISFATLGMLIVCMPFFLFAMFERTDRTLKRY